MLAYEPLKGGRIGIGGSTAGVVDRNLRGLRDLVDGALAEVRVESGRQNRERVLVSELLEEVETDAALHANERGIVLFVAPAPRGLEVSMDRAILTAALALKTNVEPIGFGTAMLQCFSGAGVGLKAPMAAVPPRAAVPAVFEVPARRAK